MGEGGVTMCERCEELEEEVAYLRQELGLQTGLEDYRRLRLALIGQNGGRTAHTRSATALVGALYRAKGRPMERLQLLDACPSPTGNEDRLLKLIDVWVCFARKTLGRDAIETVWGRGYRLTEAGTARVSAILAGEPSSEAA